MSGVQCRSIQEREERPSESCVVLSPHSPFAAVFRGLQGSKAHVVARGQKKCSVERSKTVGKGSSDKPLGQKPMESIRRRRCKFRGRSEESQVGCEHRRSESVQQPEQHT